MLLQFNNKVINLNNIAYIELNEENLGVQFVFNSGIPPINSGFDNKGQYKDFLEMLSETGKKTINNIIIEQPKNFEEKKEEKKEKKKNFMGF